MERLTEKYEDEDGKERYIHKIGECSLVDCYNKLGGLENIEDELDVSLKVLFKALKDGVYKKINNQIWKCYDLDLHYNITYHKYMLNAYSVENIETFEANYDTTLYLEDYGKTWWLEEPKEELENV